MLGDWQRAVLGAGRSVCRLPVRVGGHLGENPAALERRRRRAGSSRRPGGFDCSGFVWRVYKTKPFAGAPLLGDILKGRTTYAMSAEVDKAARIALADLAAG